MHALVQFLNETFEIVLMYVDYMELRWIGSLYPLDVIRLLTL